jgi:hypothetical protein
MMHLANGSYGDLISLEKKQRPNIHSHMDHTWKILAYYSTLIHGAFNLWSECLFVLLCLQIPMRLWSRRLPSWSIA